MQLQKLRHAMEGHWKNKLGKLKNNMTGRKDNGKNTLGRYRINLRTLQISWKKKPVVKWKGGKQTVYASAGRVLYLFH